MAFGEQDKEAKDMMGRIANWEKLRKRIFRTTKKGETGLAKISRDLYEMANLNYEFYRKVAESYSLRAKDLSEPKKPE